MKIENESPDLNGIKVVIVEDEIIIAKDITHTLEKAGYQVIRLFMSGEEAAKKIPTLGADVVLMDVYLKGKLDGIEVAEMISLSIDIPIVFITGHSEQTIISRIKFTENYGIVMKPFNTSTLLTTLELAYRNYKKKNRLAQQYQHHTAEECHYKEGYAHRMEDVLEHLSSVEEESEERLESMLDLLKDINSDFKPLVNGKVNEEKGISPKCISAAGSSDLPPCAHEYKSSITTMLNYADHILDDYDNLSVEEIRKFAAKISVCLKMLYAE